MNDTNEANPDDFFYEDEVAGSSGAKKKRSPVERVIVWTVIVAMVSIVGIEMRAKFGYDKSMAYLEDLADKGGAPLLLADVKSQLGGWPSFSGMVRPRGSHNQYCTASWLSLFKEYKVLLACSTADDPTFMRMLTEVPPNIDDLLQKLARGEPLPEFKNDQFAAGNQAQPSRSMELPPDALPPLATDPQRANQGDIPGQRPQTNATGGNPIAQFFRTAQDSPKPKFTGRTLPATPLATVFDRDETVAALNLTAEQKITLDELNARLGDKLVAAPSDREGFLKTQAEIHAEKTETLKATLTAEQFDALIKQYASWKGPFGLREPNVAAKLKLSDDQVAQLNFVFSQWLDVPALARTAAEEVAIEQCLNVLTAEQRRAWDALVGG